MSQQNTKKRKLQIDKEDYQPPFKKTKQELTVSLGKGAKCKFCKKMRDHRAIILTAYCCNLKICGYCITNYHNGPCPNCNEIVYGHKYYNPMDEILKELRQAMYVYINTIKYTFADFCFVLFLETVSMNI